jgi:hypothetical protein
MNVTRLRDQLADLEKMINTKAEQHVKRVHELQEQVRSIKEYVCWMCAIGVTYLYLIGNRQRLNKIVKRNRTQAAVLHDNVKPSMRRLCICESCTLSTRKHMNIIHRSYNNVYV